MCHQRCSVAALVLVVVAGARAGWLDRVVSYHKQRFYNEVSQLPPVSLKAELQPKPAGFADSPAWDYAAVARLLTMVRHSSTGKALRRMLRPATRRYKMSVKESMRWFPSMMKENDHLYYDVEYSSSEEHGAHNPLDGEERVLVITNPVESRLPSASISVEHLKRILEEKARVLRQMPPKRPPWLVETVTGTQDTPAAAANGTEPAGGEGSTTPPAGEGSTTTPGSSDPSSTPTATIPK